MVSFGAAALVTLLGTSADAGSHTESLPLGGGSGTAPVVIATVAPTVRTTLSSTEETQVRESISRSDLVGKTVGDAKYTVDTALWSDGAGQVIGGVALIRLDRPITLHRGFPSLAPAPRDAQGRRLDTAGAPPFTLEPAPFDASGVRTLSAYIDLRKKQPLIVALSPDPSAKATIDPEYLKTRPPLPEGGE